MSDGCGNNFMWDGIIVHGHPYTPQTYTNQGAIEVLNSTIEHARIGVVTTYLKREYEQVLKDHNQLPALNGVDGYTYGSYYDKMPTHAGIVSLENSIVKDCFYGLKIGRPDISTHSQSSNYPLFLKDNHFKAAAPLRDAYTYATPDGRVGYTKTMVYLDRLPDVKIFNNWFSTEPGAEGDLWANGIEGYNTGGLINRYCIGISSGGDCIPQSSGNVFSHLNRAVALQYTPTFASRPISIKENSFSYNHEGINVAGQSGTLKIDYNNFTIGAVGMVNNTYLPATGIKLYGNTGYEVRNNSFNTNAGFTTPTNGSIGILVQNEHDDNTQIYFNDFAYMHMASLSQVRNGSQSLPPQGLEWKCNDYYAGSRYSIARSSYNGFGGYALPTLRQQQGDCNPNDPYSPAGNRFYLGCSADNRLNSSNVGVNAPPQQVTYNNNNASTVFDPLSTCITTDFTNNSCFQFNTNDNTPRSQVCHSTRYEGYPSLRTLGQIEDDIAQAAGNADLTIALQKELYLETGNVVRDMAFRGSFDSAAVLLMQYNRYNEAFSMYMAAGNTVAAANAQSLMPEGNTEQQQLKQLYSALLTEMANGSPYADSSVNATLLQSLSTTYGISRVKASVMSGIAGLSTFTWPSEKITYGDGARMASTGLGSPIAATASDAIRIYPNPAIDVCIVETDNKATMIMVNSIGEQVIKAPCAVGKNSIHLSALAPGIYFIHVQADNGTRKVSKLTVRH